VCFPHALHLIDVRSTQTHNETMNSEEAMAYGNNPNRRSDGRAMPGFGKRRPGGRYNDDMEEKPRSKRKGSMTWEELQARRAKVAEAKRLAREQAQQYWHDHIQPVIDSNTDRKLAFNTISAMIEEAKRNRVVDDQIELEIATPLMTWYHSK
jgi:hypothetical protein